MRNALILLTVVALVIVALGAVNGSIAFDFDLVVGTWSAVSLTWVAVVVAAVVFVVGLAAAWLAQTDASRTRRKLEVELQATYERLRAAEAARPEAPPLAPAQPAAAQGTPEPPMQSKSVRPLDPAPPAADAPEDEASPAAGAGDDGSASPDG